MPRKRLRRIEMAGHGRYLTCSCNHRLPLFNNDRIKQAFVDQLALAQSRVGFDLIAWVVMPEHVHLLVLPDPPRLTVSSILSAVKRPFARRVLARWRELNAPILTRLRDGKNKAHFWLPGGGYDRNVTLDGELIEKCDYIHANPVRRGLTASATDWPWSSAAQYAGLTDEGPRIASELIA